MPPGFAWGHFFWGLDLETETDLETDTGLEIGLTGYSQLVFVASGVPYFG